MTDQLDNDPIAASIVMMRTQIAKLEAAIQTLEDVRSLILPGSSPSARNGGEVNFSHDSFFGMTAADAARKYLSAIKKTANPKVISDALVAGGWKTASKNVPENVRTILNRNSAFVVINGEFGLAEWYPGRKAVNKQRGGSVTAPTAAAADGEDAIGETEDASEGDA
jgi:hypothetical protein